MTLVIMFLIWLLLGAIAAVLAGNIWHGNRPIGERGDYLVAIVFAVLIGVADWYLLPMMNITGTLRFLVAVVEPFLSALIALWVVRLIKK